MAWPSSSTCATALHLVFDTAIQAARGEWPSGASAFRLIQLRVDLLLCDTVKAMLEPDVGGHETEILSIMPVESINCWLAQSSQRYSRIQITLMHPREHHRQRFPCWRPGW